MEILSDFLSKNFPEQMNILINIGKEKNKQYLPELFSLYHTLTGDKTVDAMVIHTLRDILLENESETIDKIISGSAKEKRLCLQVAGKKQFPSAVPALMELVKQESDMAVLSEAFIAMSAMGDSRFLEVFRKYLCHTNEIVSGISIEMIARYKDYPSQTKLEEIINEAESGRNYETCTICTAKAIEALASLGNDESIRFLVSEIHHKNPTARRLVQEQLINTGERTLPFFEDIFAGDKPGIKIMAANTLGRIGGKKAGEILISALDKGKNENDNVRAAICEAIGRIRFLKGLVCLTEALAEENLQILIAAVSGIEQQLSPEVIKVIKGNIEKNDSHSEKTIQAVVSAKALQIFEHLYAFDSFRERLIAAVLRSNDTSVLDAFAAKLQTMPGENVVSDREKILSHKAERRDIRILAVDDSESMRTFYRSVISELGIEPELADNGRAALDRLQSGETYNLILTDLNMPVMDGIELTRVVRENPFLKEIPIIMATTEADFSQKHMAEKSGVNDYISKPIDAGLLKEKINAFFL